MYINDLPNCSAISTAVYANDTYLCLSHKNLNDLQLTVDKLLSQNRVSNK